jgi:hypothetical protein
LLAQPADAPPGEKLAYSVRDLTVQIISSHGQNRDDIAAEGYGFVVAQQGDVVTVATADHVVRDPDGTEYGEVRVIFYADQAHPQAATVLDLRLPPTYGDLAVLEVKKPGFRMSQPPVASLPPTQGERAWRIGKQHGWTPGNVPGAFTGTERTIWLGFDNLDTPRGSSGGPIVVEQGLVGMVTDDQSGRALVLPINVIANFFHEKGLPWGLGGSPQPSASPQSRSPVASNVITIWKVGSPYDGSTPDASVEPQLASLAQKFGHKLAVRSLLAMDFFDRFKDAVARHEEPDIFTIDNWGLMTGTNTPLGQFVGLLSISDMKERLTLVYRSLQTLVGSKGGWEFLVSGSPNADAARALALRDPECDPSWTSGMGPGELNQIVPEAASAFLRNDSNALTRVSDSERIARGPQPNFMPQPFDQVRSPLEVTGVSQCSYWGNNRLRFGVLVLRFETPKMIGNTPVLLILRNDNQQWRLLAATEDRATLDALPSELKGLQFPDASSASLGGPAPAQLLSPTAGQAPQPNAGQRFGDYVWQPSTSPDLAAEIAEFNASYGSRLFLRKRNGRPPAKDSVSAGQLTGGPAAGWGWRVWSITNSGIVVFSERR